MEKFPDTIKGIAILECELRVSDDRAYMSPKPKLLFKSDGMQEGFKSDVEALEFALAVKQLAKNTRAQQIEEKKKGGGDGGGANGGKGEAVGMQVSMRVAMNHQKRLESNLALLEERE